MGSFYQFLTRATVESRDQRFTRLFNSVLARIPDDVKPLESVGRVSLRKVGSMPGLVGLTRWSGRDWREDGEREGDDSDYRGRAPRGTQTITYYSLLLDQLSDEACVAVIAHELAHAWLNEHVLPHQSPEREREADELAASWGFGRELAQLNCEADPIGESVY